MCSSHSQRSSWPHKNNTQSGRRGLCCSIIHFHHSTPTAARYNIIHTSLCYCCSASTRLPSCPYQTSCRAQVCRADHSQHIHLLVEACGARAWLQVRGSRCCPQTIATVMVWVLASDAATHAQHQRKSQTTLLRVRLFSLKPLRGLWSVLANMWCSAAAVLGLPL